MEILQSKFTNTVINAQSKKIEEQILEVVNAVSVTPKSTQEVQDKWRTFRAMQKENSVSLK